MVGPGRVGRAACFLLPDQWVLTKFRVWQQKSALVGWLVGPKSLKGSGRRIGGRCVGGSVTFGVSAVVGDIIRLALGLALELFFFFAFFRKLFLALFVRVIGSCHCVLS